MKKSKSWIDGRLKELERLRGIVESCLADLSNDSARRTTETRPCRDRIVQTLVAEHGLSHEVADEIAFHMVDWSTDAAFLVSLCFFPERFSLKDTSVGLSVFLAHAPNHVAAAAKLFDLPVQDIFGVGPLEEPYDEDSEDQD